MKKMRKLANGLTAEDLRALAIECKMPEATYGQLPGLVDALIADYHDALLDQLELRINEVARDHELACLLLYCLGMRLILRRRSVDNDLAPSGSTLTTSQGSGTSQSLERT